MQAREAIVQEEQLDCMSILKLAAQSFNLQFKDLAPGIYICATPIGNRADISLRNLYTLSQVDEVYAEDTRVTKSLLLSYGIFKRIIRMDEALIVERSGELLDKVEQGKAIAYCSDAGMPGISDPGLRLVERAHNRGGSRVCCARSKCVRYRLCLFWYECYELSF